MKYYEKTASDKWPFIGLRPFKYKDHQYFFGRSKELDILESLVTKKHFVAIVGSSGSGKSSLISAGLRQRLPNNQWSWIETRPLDAPLRNLALALAHLTGEADLLLAWADRCEQVLNRSSYGITEALGTITKQSGGRRFLLLVDQFEELFRFAGLRSESSLDPTTFDERRDEAAAFVRLLLAATEAREVPIHVVVTMRSDFIGDCARFHGLPRAVSESQFLVPGMTRDQREEAIREPLARADAKIDPDVVQYALNATNEEYDQLPILQHVMMRCWERADRRCAQDVDHRPHITIDDYKAVGGVERALSAHANEIHDDLAGQLDPTTIGFELATKRVFQALIETDKKGNSVRRPQRFRDLLQYVRPDNLSEAAAKEATSVVVDRFARYDCSFLRVDRSAGTDGHSVDADSNSGITDNSIIDIGHEALIRRWEMLEGQGKENWVREEERDADEYRSLLRYADMGDMIPPKDLTRLEDWWSRRKPNSFWANRYTKHNEANFEKIREHLAQSRIDANRTIQTHQRNEFRIITILANAIRNPRLYSGPADSLSMALANRRSDFPTIMEYIEVLYNGLGELRERRRIYSGKNVFAVSFAPSVKLLAAAVHGSVLFFDTDTYELVHSRQIPNGWVLSLRWSPDGERIYVGTSPIGVIIAASSIKELRKYFTDCSKDKWALSINIGSEEHPAGYGAWSHDGKWIVVTAWQRRAGIWDTAEGRFQGLISDERLGSNQLDYMFSGLAASADGKRFALGAFSGKIHIFDIRASGQDGLFLKFEKSLSSIDGNLTPNSLAFNPQNPDQLIASYMPSAHMALWNIDKNIYVSYENKESGIIWRVVFDPKGQFVASATNDALVMLWTSHDPDSIAQLKGHLGSVMCVDISSDDGIIASGSFDGTIRLWAREAPLSATSLSSSVSMPAPSSFSVQDRQMWVTADNGKKYLITLPEQFEASAAAVSATGAGVAVVPRSGRPHLIVNLPGYAMSKGITLPGANAEWTAVAFIEDDRRIMAKTKEGNFFSWPFYPDVSSLEDLAKQHMPLVRDKNGFEKQLSGPRLAEAQIPPSSDPARPSMHSAEYIIPFWREVEVANAKSLQASSESRQGSIKWLANNSQIIELTDTVLHNFNLERVHVLPKSSFVRTNLKNGSFEQSVLQGANFMCATITSLNFSNAELRGARFDEAVVATTSFERADLRRARFDGARLLSEVDFSQADINEASFRSVTYDSLPNFDRTAWWLASGWNLGQIADFTKRFGKADPAKRRVVGAYPMFDRELNRFDTVLNKTSDNILQRLTAMDGKAWTLAIHGIDLVEAERIARDALEIANNSELSNEEKVKPLSFVSDTLAYILIQTHRPEEALALKKEDYGMQDPGGIFRHALVFHMLGDEKEALDMLKGSKLAKTYSPSHEMFLLYNYLVGSGRKFMDIFRDVAKQQEPPITLGGSVVSGIS
jgi:WD40 repeat protein/uncharacterized protein YjbI with pentapeptide repeats